MEETSVTPLRMTRHGVNKMTMMKRLINFLMLVVLGAIAWTACQDETPSVDDPAGASLPVKVRLTLPESLTKAAFSDELGITWEAGDVIRFWGNTGSVTATLAASDITDGNKAVFDMAIPNVVNESPKGVFQYHWSTRNEAEWDFGDGTSPFVVTQAEAGVMNKSILFMQTVPGPDWGTTIPKADASPAEISLEMQLTGSIFRVIPYTEAYNDETIQSVSLSAGDQNLGGTVAYNYAEGSYRDAQTINWMAYKENIVNLGTGFSLSGVTTRESSKGIYFAVPRTNTDLAGYTVVVTTDKAKYTYVSESAYAVQDNVVRNIFLKLDAEHRQENAPAGDFTMPTARESFLAIPGGQEAQTITVVSETEITVGTVRAASDGNPLFVLFTCPSGVTVQSVSGTGFNNANKIDDAQAGFWIPSNTSTDQRTLVGKVVFTDGTSTREMTINIVQLGTGGSETPDDPTPGDFTMPTARESFLAIPGGQEAQTITVVSETEITVGTVRAASDGNPLFVLFTCPSGVTVQSVSGTGFNNANKIDDAQAGFWIPSNTSTDQRTLVGKVVFTDGNSTREMTVNIVQAGLVKNAVELWTSATKTYAKGWFGWESSASPADCVTIGTNSIAVSIPADKNQWWEWADQNFILTNIVPESGKHYDFSCKITSNHTGESSCTLKLATWNGTSDEGEYFYKGGANLLVWQAGETCNVSVEGMSYIAANGTNPFLLIVDLGYNAAGITVTVSDISLQEY